MQEKEKSQSQNNAKLHDLNFFHFEFGFLPLNSIWDNEHGQFDI